MSEVTAGIIRMPLDVALGDPLANLQYHAAANSVLDQLEVRDHQVNVLAEAIIRIAEACGATLDDAPFTGPHVLMLADETRGYVRKVADQRHYLIATLKQCRLWAISKAGNVSTTGAQIAIIDHALAKVQDSASEADNQNQ